MNISPEHKVTSKRRSGWPLVMYAILLAGWLACLTWLSLSPHVVKLPRWLGWDKMQHAIAYGLLTYLAGLFLYELIRKFWLGWICAAMGSFFVGLLMEWAQHTLTRNRVAEFLDLVADTLGSLIVLAIRFWYRGGQR